MGRPKLSFDAQFWANTAPEPNNGCLLWAAGVDDDGYGITNALGRSMRAHRVAWQVQRGDIPAGMQVLHRCDVPPCVNVDHLFLGTSRDNRLDQWKKGRSCAGERNGRAKLKASDIAEIRTAFSYGTTRAALARKHDVTWRTISLIVSGFGWRVVPLRPDPMRDVPA